MKRALGLTLSFLVCFSGLVLLTPAPARTQEVASVGNIVKLREQYEQLLAVDRDPSTPTEVREVNRTFLKERRAQLAQALRNRLGALRKYQAGVAATLTDDEKRAVEGSIQKLADELKGLEPASVGTRPSRVVSKTAQSKQVVPASFDEDAAASAAPDSDPKPARKAGAIEITSPDRDKTVHVGQIEVEVSVGDEDVDDIMVAVYTPGSGQKPATARSLELKRSDHGKKTFPLALEAGANRIEVSDLKR
ncbi:MAG: hypothetical protein QOE46_3238, partial [Acidobacteriota bacterium]|nr:hypothetical protein [Acidobacteriota bacterium]